MIHGPVRAPDEAGLGIATLKLSFPDWKEGRVVPATAEIRVVERGPGKGQKERK
jgi:hypothetical protein